MGVTAIRQPNQSEQALGAARSLFDRTRGERRKRNDESFNMELVWRSASCVWGPLSE